MYGDVRTNWTSNYLETKHKETQRKTQTKMNRIKEDLKMLGERNAEGTAKDREEWKQVVVAAMGLKGM